MNIDLLILVVTILITLSIASERLVEIIKGFMPKLSAENLEGKEEAWRKAQVSILAVICGIVTAFLASPLLGGLFKKLIPENSDCKLKLGFMNWGETTPCGFDFINPNGIFLVIALGLLAAGGSSLWNSVLEYLLKVKDLKKVEVKRNDALRVIEVERAAMLKAIEIERAQKITGE